MDICSECWTPLVEHLEVRECPNVDDPDPTTEAGGPVYRWPS